MQITLRHASRKIQSKDATRTTAMKLMMMMMMIMMMMMGISGGNRMHSNCQRLSEVS